MKQTRQWYYRGSLKSCNYSCSYCPFSKKRSSAASLSIDKQQFFRFIEHLEQSDSLKGAVQIVPYGEALIHSYYWEGLARLSNIPGMEAVGAQSNFSFPIEKMLTHYTEKGGQLSKLRLWGTFHPEMTSVSDFLSQCELLLERNVLFCIGAVGNPQYISEILSLRQQLNNSVYLWINKMDGLKRNYTSGEIQAFESIDEYFHLELKHHKANEALCQNQIFVEADGSMRRCNLCKQSTHNLYEQTTPTHTTKEHMPDKHMPNEHSLAQSTPNRHIADTFHLPCTKKMCSCYLAYNNRNDMDLFFFRPYPAFRIPTYPKAVFLDIDGTVIPKGQTGIPKEICSKIKALSKHSAIYLATSLPRKDALRKVADIRALLTGGVFASGADCVIFDISDKKKHTLSYERITPMPTEWIEGAKLLQKEYGYRIHIYEQEAQVYKVTLAFPKGKVSRMNEPHKFLSDVAHSLKLPKSCRCFIEENCIEIVHTGRGKLQGILDIMKEMRYCKDEVFVVGDSAEDEAMLAYFPWALRVK